MAKAKEPKAPKAPKEKKPKKEKPPKKPKPPKKGKPPKKPKKGQEVPLEGEELEQQGKKKFPILLILIPVVLIAALAVVFFLVIRPRLGGGDAEADDPDAIETPEPLPPELPEELMVGDISVPGMQLEADESEAQAVRAKTVTYTYVNLNDAGAVAETYVSELKSASPGFSLVDEDFVRLSADPDFTAAEGVVLMARNLSRAEIEAEFGTEEEEEETPEPTEAPEDESGDSEETGTVTAGIALTVKELFVSGPEDADSPGEENPEDSAPEEPADKTPSYVISVRITWSEGRCVVVADEVEGEVTSPQSGGPGGTPSIGLRDAEEQLLSMTPAELGLPGTSMTKEYEVFWQEGTELVNGVTCIRLDVYNSSDGPNPYLFASSYLMSVDGAHLYKLDPITGDVQELEFTLVVG